MLIELADFIFEIETIYPDTEEMCREYAIETLPGDRIPEGKIIITPQDIQREREITIQEALTSGQYENGMVPDYPEGYLETTAVYRKIADMLSYRNACVFHGALIDCGGEGYLFTAGSGTGKTTHISNWLKVFPEAFVVNGDKPILRLREDGRIYGYGTPWAGKEGFQTQTFVPVKAIVMLERGRENRIESVPAGSVISRLLGQCYRPHDEQGMKRAMEMCMAIVAHTQLYRLQCNMDQESARVAYEGMQSS